MRYHDVKRDAAAMRRFLEVGGGDRRVPLIVEHGDAGGASRTVVGHGGS